jgi:glycosyltransferase involved in cell wall biosynthesis
MVTQRTLVLIPAFNESKNIAGLVNEIRSLGYETLVIDDGSTDATPQILKSLDTHFIISEKNQGKGAALRRGFAWFLQGAYDYLILMDADGQHAPSEIVNFLERLRHSGASVIVGNRLADAGRMPSLRYWTNRVMSATLSLIAGQKIQDTQCGFRALTRQAVEKIHLKRDRFEVESEMVLEAAKHHLRIESIAIRSIYEGQSSHIQPFKDTIRFLRFLASRLFEK